MGMLRSVVHVEVLDELAAQTVFGEHAFYHADVEGVHTGLEVLVEGFLHEHFGGKLALTAGVAGVVEINFVSQLFACEDNFVCINDDDIVAAFYEGAVAGFVFAAKNFSDFRAETTEMLVCGVDENPFALNLLCVW